MKHRINDEKRRLWVLSDEGLYTLHRRSGKSVKRFIREHRAEIDAAISAVESGRQPQHYLVYGGNNGTS